MGLRELFTGISLGAVCILFMWYYEMQLHFGFKVAIAATVLLYMLVPMIFHFSSTIQRHLIFLPFVRYPTDINIIRGESEGIPGTRNFFLPLVEMDHSIGVWHILPKSLVNASRGKTGEFWTKSILHSEKPVVIYFHGNSGSRADSHRKELYSVLQELDCHVITFDYRGYADSTPMAPSETSTVSDGITVYRYIRQAVGGKDSQTPVFVWGHSLGTGVSSHVVAKLCSEGDGPDALFLESPFTSIGEEVKHHMLTAIYRYLPFFDWIIVRPLEDNDIAFRSYEHLEKIEIPVLIMHAVDDPVVPYFLGQKLYNIGHKTRSVYAKPLYFRGFGQGYAHKFICRAPELPELIRDFIYCAVHDEWPCPGFDETLNM